MSKFDSARYRDNFETDLQWVIDRLNHFKTDAEVNLKYGYTKTTGTRSFQRIRRDLLDLDIGDRKVIRNCDTSSRAMKHKQAWNAALQQLSKMSADDIAELRGSRMTFGRTTYNGDLHA